MTHDVCGCVVTSCICRGAADFCNLLFIKISKKKQKKSKKKQTKKIENFSNIFEMRS